MNLKEAIELIDHDIDKQLLDFHISYDAVPYGVIKGRLSQMKLEVLNLDSIYEMKINESYENEKIFRSYIKRIEALNILINHLEEVLK